MRKASLAWLLALSLSLSSCATAEKSTVLGAAIGSVVGGTIGALASQHSGPGERTTGVVLGVGFGVRYTCSSRRMMKRSRLFKLMPENDVVVLLAA